MGPAPRRGGVKAARSLRRPRRERLQGARLLPADLRCQAVLSREWFVILEGEKKNHHKNNKTKALTLPPPQAVSEVTLSQS